VSTEPLDAVSPHALDGDAAAGFFTAEGDVLVPAEFGERCCTAGSSAG
jgi:hypothetical protein